MIVRLAALAVEAQVRGQRRRRTHQLFLRARVAHELHEPVDRLGRRGEARRCRWRRNACGASRLASSPSQHGNDGLRACAPPCAPCALPMTALPRQRARGERGRAIHDQDGVGARRRASSASQGAPRSARRIGIADDVDRIAVRPGRRQDGVERRSRRLGEARERPSRSPSRSAASTPAPPPLVRMASRSPDERADAAPGSRRR